MRVYKIKHLNLQFDNYKQISYFLDYHFFPQKFKIWIENLEIEPK